jgi:hypothetical protein
MDNMFGRCRTIDRAYVSGAVEISGGCFHGGVVASDHLSDIVYASSLLIRDSQQKRRICAPPI